MLVKLRNGGIGPTYRVNSADYYPKIHHKHDMKWLNKTTTAKLTW